MRRWLICLIPGLVLGLVAQAVGGEPFALKDNARVIFFGDSITQAGGYVTDVEFFLLTRFPDRQFTIINHGISSETISGTSETDHEPRRPDAHNRFTRDVTAWKPTHVVACFGMNDGNYHPFEPSRFQKYQEGVNRLLHRLETEANASLTLLTPPAFDPYQRKASDPAAIEYGYKFAAIDYDQTLRHYADWLLTLNQQESSGPLVGDVHAAFTSHLAKRRREQVSFFLSGDAVHPGPTGHWLMAQTLLETWKAPATVATLAIDAANLLILEGDAGALERDTDPSTLRFGWRTPLPMVFDPSCEPKSLDLEQVPKRLNHHVLRVTGLDPETSYTMIAKYAMEREASAPLVLTGTQLDRGIDVTTLPQFPTVKRATQARAILAAANAAAYKNWRQEIAQHPEAIQAPSIDPEKAEAVAQVRQLCQPQAVLIEIRKTDPTNK